MQITHFTDPGCPFAFSAEPARLQLRWHYGDQLSWKTVLIGLAEDGAAYEAKGFTPERQAKAFGAMQRKYGMPMDTSERSGMSGTFSACRAIVATRLQQPELEGAILRRLRVRGMGGELFDDRSTIDGAASDVGIDPEQLQSWIAEPATEEAFQADLKAARTPSKAALALDHKLGDSGDGGRRYTAPSMVFGDGDDTITAPGFQPFESYDVAVANLDATLDRRPAPSEAAEVLEWAQMPVATAEVAALLGVDLDRAREQLEQAAASFERVGDDGYWTIQG